MPNTTVRAAAEGLPAVLIIVAPPRVFPDFSRPAPAVDPVETERAMNAVLEALNAILASEEGSHV